MSDTAPCDGLLKPRLSPLDAAVAAHGEEAAKTKVALLLTPDNELEPYQAELAGALFVGHLATDMDSIGSAVGAAELFGGTATRASEINSETAYALETFGVALPPRFEDAVVAAGNDAKVVLVDHCQTTQMNAAVDPATVVGIIDHHALQASTLTTDLPIYIDIRPWGSACTIIAHTFVTLNRPISRPTAALLLCGILSDTLNLRSPTSTRHDAVMVALLCTVLELDDPNALAKSLFKAKSRTLSLLSAHQLVRGDQKTFDLGCADGTSLTVGFGVVETTDVEAMRARRDELLFECRALKKEESLDMAFLALVDIANLRSELLLCGPREAALAVATYGGSVEAASSTLDLGDRVSRKKNFIPPLSQTLQSGFAFPPDLASYAEPDEEFGKVVTICTPTGCMTQRRGPAFAAVASAAVAATAFAECGHAHAGPH
ncbi:inorganic diphosphatase [Thecamonas trahens ATCC 50062]|uniref:inorganic diphosphatase n=1 Tax=Thecamonas trahens ATCC 50062 TaxID=461836 RepID=A0A0L0DQY2_THETB|nr:inorganic diphosphatase [Thecamonas trahens ATCC 50062]KNC54680.1 inorganic diphosphatase [Thecamonas trahens ATCC 50062]|eukprot:XP_013761582.1 inorganic diphosphatase [Thecamonas trahens ATCC 50062]